MTLPTRGLLEHGPQPHQVLAAMFGTWTLNPAMKRASPDIRHLSGTQATATAPEIGEGITKNCWIALTGEWLHIRITQARTNLTEKQDHRITGRSPDATPANVQRGLLVPGNG